jgi:hypothetical protein
LLARQRQLTKQLEKESGRIMPSVFHRNGKRLWTWKDKEHSTIHLKASVRKDWKEACAKAGFPDRIFHDFRRSAVRRLEQAGVPRSVATQLTGHRSEAVYRRYAITSGRDLHEGVGKLADLDGTIVAQQAHSNPKSRTTTYQSPTSAPPS